MTRLNDSQHAGLDTSRRPEKAWRYIARRRGNRGAHCGWIWCSSYLVFLFIETRVWGGWAGACPGIISKTACLDAYRKVQELEKSPSVGKIWTTSDCFIFLSSWFHESWTSRSGPSYCILWIKHSRIDRNSTSIHGLFSSRITFSKNVRTFTIFFCFWFRHGIWGWKVEILLIPAFISVVVFRLFP